MTLPEFSNQFDVLVSSYRRFKDFDKKEELDSIEFNEYEKSIFLTQAQEDLVLALYNGKNVFGESFESTEELRRHLSGLISEATLNPLENSSHTGITALSQFFHLPDDLWFITYEAIQLSAEGKCFDGKVVEVVPITQDEYHRVKDNPFRGPSRRRALRLDLPGNDVEIVSIYGVQNYYIRYLKTLPPIILETLPNGLTIKDELGPQECTLHESLHQSILEQAVAMALRTKVGTKDND